MCISAGLFLPRHNTWSNTLKERVLSGFSLGGFSSQWQRLEMGQLTFITVAQSREEACLH